MHAYATYAAIPKRKIVKALVVFCGLGGNLEISKDEMTHHIMPLSLHKNLSSCTVAALLHLAGSSTPPSLGTSNRFRSNLQPSLDGNGKGGELVDVRIVLKIMWKRAEESITGIINN